MKADGFTVYLSWSLAENGHDVFVNYLRRPYVAFQMVIQMSYQRAHHDPPETYSFVFSLFS